MALFKNKIRYNDGSKYEGDLVNNVRHGTGTYYFADGSRYDGGWCNNKMHGYGVFDYSKGGIYEGNFAYDNRNGFGTMFFANGAKYEGQWRKDTFWGKGKLIYANGDIYEGKFVDGKKQGVGKYSFAEGNYFYGHFKSNKYHGLGRYYLDNGDILEHCFYNDEALTNRIYHSSGSVYIGELNKAVKDGLGMIFFKSGNYYKGEFKNNNYCGLGVFFYADGSIYIGNFVDDDYEGMGIIYNNDGSRYEGEFIDDLSNGFGVLFKEDGKRYIGYFDSDLYHGIGYEEFDGYTFLGEYEYGKKNGIGRISYADGAVIISEYENDELHGQCIFMRNGKVITMGTYEHGKCVGVFNVNGAYIEQKLQNLIAKFNIINYEDGSSYFGGFSGKREGKGAYFSSDGKLKLGIWVNDKIVGESIHHFMDYTYIGYYDNGFERKGLLCLHNNQPIEENTNYIISEYSNGKCNGKYIRYMNDDCFAMCYYIDDLMEKTMIYKTETNKMLIADMHNDLYHGSTKLYDLKTGVLEETYFVNGKVKEE